MGLPLLCLIVRPGWGVVWRKVDGPVVLHVSTGGHSGGTRTVLEAGIWASVGGTGGALCLHPMPAHIYQISSNQILEYVEFLVYET